MFNSLFRFSIRDLLWLTLVVVLIVVIVRDRWGVVSVALDGYCPVTLVHSRRWQIGDLNYRTIHEGKRYLFASTTEKEMFLAQPIRYMPVCGGNDVVRLTDEHRQSAGNRRYGLTFHSRIYLFDSEETLREFEAKPSTYLQP